MPAPDAEDGQYVDYLAPVVGSTVIGISEEDDCVWFYLSDGSQIEFFAEPDGGFGVEIHQPGLVH